MRLPSRWRRGRAAAWLAAALLASPAAIAQEDGKDVFHNYCSSCHGADGRAQTSPGHYYRIPDWTATDAVRKLSDEQIRTQIRTGKLRPDVFGMPAFRSLSDAQVDALIAFVRKLASK